jgi:cyd operon protein YbgT
MWYFAWILGTLLACAFGVITALALEHVEAPKQVKKNTDEYYRDSVRDNGQAPVKGAFLIDGAAAGGCIFWDPSRFAAKPASWKSGTVSC